MHTRDTIATTTMMDDTRFDERGKNKTTTNSDDNDHTRLDAY